MKDKLVKYNRKARYYRTRKTCIVLGFVFASALAFIIPVSITLSAQNRANAEVTTSESIEDNNEQYNTSSLDAE